MKYVLFLLLSLPAMGQSSERLLTDIAGQLSANRHRATAFFWPGQRTMALSDTAKKTAEYYTRHGQRYLFDHDLSNAVLMFEKGAELDPKEHGYLGFTFLNHWHDYPRAIRHFDAYDALTPDFDDIEGNNPVSYLRGVVYQKMGDHQKAIEQMSHGIDPIDLKHGSEWVNYRYFINRAVSYLALNQPDKALSDLDKAVQNFTRSALAQYYRGKALVALNRRAEAKTAFRDASFFMKALRVERRSEQEDDYNPVCDEEIDEALTGLK